MTLLSDPENIVKQTLLENGITQLCVFFGRQKANDVLLSHMITFLNDKQDWQLRGAFFDSIVGVAAYVGWQSLVMLRPLLEQVRAIRKGTEPINSCNAFWVCYKGQEKNWPIADRRVLSNDPRNHCWTRFDCSSLFYSNVANAE